MDGNLKVLSGEYFDSKNLAFQEIFLQKFPKENESPSNELIKN
jgi:hypothetical protein